MSSEVHIDDVGVKLIVTVQSSGQILDLSSYSSILLKIKKPDSSTISRSGIIYSTGLDGKFYYNSASGDFNLAGYYKLQSTINFPSGNYHSDIYTFQVSNNL
jgi:hypothetical protein